MCKVHIRFMDIDTELTNHVGINEQNAPSHVPATITPKYLRRYILWM